jgi:hypothetical protein
MMGMIYQATHREALMKKYVVAILVAMPMAVLLLNTGQAGGGKGSPWKPFLPAAAYAELTKRSIATIEGLAKSDLKDAAERAEFEAAILAGYTLVTKSDKDVVSLRGAALEAAKVARKGGLKKLADFKAIQKAAPPGPAEIKDWKPYLQELQWMMETFRGKTKGGEGLHADLHYQVKLKNLNGIEALIGALSGKKLSEENVTKVSKELSLLSYRVAVIGAITHEFAPDKNAGQWRELSIQMRDSAAALGESAAMKDANRIMAAAQTLENSCTQCHTVFKNK